MSINPAKIIGIEHDLEVGLKANLAVFDLEEEYVITKESIKSKSINTPFLETKCFGALKYHVLDGNMFWGISGGEWQSTGLKEHLDYYRPENTTSARTKPGRSLAEFYLRKTDGIFKTQKCVETAAHAACRTGTGMQGYCQAVLSLHQSHLELQIHLLIPSLRFPVLFLM